MDGKYEMGNILKKLRARKYRSRVYLLIVLAICAVLTLFSFLSYYNVEHVVLNKEYDINRRILYQIRFNMESMSKQVENLTFELYYKPEVKEIMYSRSVDMDGVITELSDIKDKISSYYPSVQSVYIYNGNTKLNYTTRNGEMIYNDAYLNMLISSHPQISTLKPMLRKMELNSPQNEKITMDVFSYFMYDYRNADGSLSGAIVINESAEAIFNDIRLLTDAGEDNGESYFIEDRDGALVSGVDSEDAAAADFQARLKAGLSGGRKLQADEFSAYTAKVGSAQYLVSELDIAPLGWTLIKTQPLDKLYASVNVMRRTYEVLTLLFVLLAIGTAWAVARSIYKPIGRLVSAVSSARPAPSGEKGDEIAYLNEIYSDTIDQLSQAKSKINMEAEMLKSLFLRRLLTRNHSIAKEEFLRNAQEFGIRLSADAPAAVCVLRIDHYRKLQQVCGESELDRYRFAVMNVARETFAQSFGNECVDLKSDSIVVIMNVSCGREEYAAKMRELAGKAQEHILEYFKISVTASAGYPAEDFSGAYQSYEQALEGMHYTFNFGRMTVLTPEMTAANAGNPQTRYPADLERSLLREIRGGSTASVEAAFKAVTAEIAALSHNNITASLVYLVNVIANAYDEVNRSRIEPVPNAFAGMTQELFGMETLGEFEERCRDAFAAMEEHARAAENDKHLAVVSAVKEIVAASYADAGLCLQQVADRLGVSAKHLAKIFNGIALMSVADYITEVRLQKAVEWLERTNLSVTDILPKIGLENTSYFYKLFKQKYGVTPKEYMLGRAIKKL